jgi:outer membrane lipoprotein-sorting protein
MATLSRSRRWAVPAGVLALVTGGVLAGHAIGAAANPGLPHRSAQQLVADVATANPPGVSGTIVETASLGLPSMPTGNADTSLTSLLSGSHTSRLWYADPQHVRFAIQADLAETDLIRNGKNLWTWTSSSNTVDHRTLTEHPDQKATTPEAPLTPDQASKQLLAKLGPTTRVSTDGTASVAGRASYELVLDPRDTKSLIGTVRIAVDAKTHVPLRLRVYARGAGSPAAEIGFTSVSFSKPSASQFTFKAPPGSTVTEAGRGPDGMPGRRGDLDLMGPSQTVGTGWTAVMVARDRHLAWMVREQTAEGHNHGGDGMMSALVQSATPVSGTWGSGRLLRTKLLSVLLTDDGRLFAGAVTPDVLYQAAGSHP